MNETARVDCYVLAWHDALRVPQNQPTCCERWYLNGLLPSVLKTCTAVQDRIDQRSLTREACLAVPHRPGETWRKRHCASRLFVRYLLFVANHPPAHPAPVPATGSSWCTRVLAWGGSRLRVRQAARGAQARHGRCVCRSSTSMRTRVYAQATSCPVHGAQAGPAASASEGDSRYRSPGLAPTRR